MERVEHGGGARRAGPLRLAMVLAAAALAAALATVVISLQAGPAEAAFPGQNDRIAFNIPDGTERNDYEIYTANPDGSNRIQITDNAVDDLDPAFSSDGRSLVYNVLSSGPGGDTGIYRIDLGQNGKPSGGRTPVVTSEDGRFAAFPAWSPDGKQIVFSMDDGEGGEGGPGDLDIYRTKSNGEGNPIFVADVGEFDAYPAWSPNGKTIAFSQSIILFTQEQSAVYLVPVTGGNPSPITQPEESAYGPNWSPDGKRIAYAGLDPEAQSPFEYQIFTRTARGEPVQVTDTSGSINVFPAFSPRGDQISFRAIQVPGNVGLNNLESAARTLDVQELESRSVGDVGTLGGPPETFSAIGRVSSDGGEERLVPGTGNTEGGESLFIDLIFPGPDWGPKPGKADGGGDDRPECTIQGTRRDDAINGTDRRDVICAGAGADTINALDGNDVVYGGSGSDSINGGNGDDELFGEGGDDTLNGGSGKDKLEGGPGRDDEAQ